MELSQAIHQAITEFGKDIITEKRFVNILSDYGVFTTAPAWRSVVIELISSGTTRKVLNTALTSGNLQSIVKNLSFEFTRVWPFQENIVETILFGIVDAIYHDDILELEISKDGKTLKTLLEGRGIIRLPYGIEIISSNSLRNNDEITKVILSQSIKRIENYAFDNCENLEEIFIPASVEECGYFWIQSCKKLKRIVLEKPFYLGFIQESDVEIIYQVESTTIGYSSYNDCLYSENGEKLLRVPQHIKELIIPDGVIEIGERAFESGMIEHVQFPETLEVIHNSAFHSCDNLIDLHFPKSLKTIGDYAFCCCYNLDNIYLRSQIFYIGAGAFEECYGLKQAVIDATCQTIPERLFARCENLTSIKISEGIETIGENAFINCSKLTICDLPSSIKEIDMFCFSGCNKLDNYHIPAGIKKINNPGLSGSYTVESDNCCFASYQGCLYSKDYTVLYAVPRNKSTLIIKDGCIKIAQYAAADCHKLKKVFISGCVKSIEDSAFRDCSTLQDVTLEDGVEEIGINAFCGCEGIRKIKLPDSVKYLQNCTFYGCKALKDIILPSELISIGKECFKNCTSLLKISLPESLKEIGEGAFTWSSIQNITIPQSVRRIGSNAFAFSKVGSITIKAAYEKHIFGHRDGHEVFYVDGTKEIIFHVLGDFIESYKKYLPSNSKVIAIPGTTTPPPRELKINDLFPIDGITLGKSTWKSATRLGFCVDKIHNSEERIVITSNGIFGDMTGKGVFNYYLPNRLPKEWSELGLKQEMSYNAIIQFFNEYNCDIKNTQEPTIVKYEDRDTLVASFVIRPQDNSWRMKFIFKEGANVLKGTELDTKYTLCDVVVKV